MQDFLLKSISNLRRNKTYTKLLLQDIHESENLHKG